MSYAKLVSLTLMTMAVALSGAVTATTQATEGPFFKAEGSRLGATQTRLLLAIAKENFTLEVVALGQTITCTALSLPEASQMQIQGSEGATGGKGRGVVRFTGCTQTGNGTPCELENGFITTVPIIGLLAYSASTRSGAVLVLFEPEVGRVFTTLKYTGAGCKVASQAITGTVIALSQIGGNQVQVGSGTETLHGDVKFHKGAKTAFVEKAGSLVEIKGKLELAGISATLQGTGLLLAELVLASGQADPINWGVFS